MENKDFIIRPSNLFCDVKGFKKDQASIVIEQLKEKIDHYGYCVLRGVGFKDEGLDNKKNKLYQILSNIGTLTGHNTGHEGQNLDSMFWDIKFRGEDYNKENKTTFSEQTGECPLHSDSSFIFSPEDYLIMYVVKPAETGGESLFLSYKNLSEKLLETAEGKRCLEILNTYEYPFQTPKSFDVDERIIWAKVIDQQEGSIRFRHDCIQKGIALNADKISAEMQWAIDFLTSVINIFENINEFSALEDDIIFINNRKGLHARKDFKDASRHYIRARISAT